jgi:hypothetical protein
MLLYGIGHGYRGGNLGGGSVDLWWVPIGLAIWFGVAVVAALFIGPVLRRSSEDRKALDQQLRDLSGGPPTVPGQRQAARGTGASDAEPPRARSASPGVPPPSDGAGPYPSKQPSTQATSTGQGKLPWLYPSTSLP